MQEKLKVFLTSFVTKARAVCFLVGFTFMMHNFGKQRTYQKTEHTRLCCFVNQLSRCVCLWWPDGVWRQATNALCGKDWPALHEAPTLNLVTAGPHFHFERRKRLQGGVLDLREDSVYATFLLTYFVPGRLSMRERKMWRESQHPGRWATKICLERLALLALHHWLARRCTMTRTRIPIPLVTIPLQATFASFDAGLRWEPRLVFRIHAVRCAYYCDACTTRCLLLYLSRKKIKGSYVPIFRNLWSWHTRFLEKLHNPRLPHSTCKKSCGGIRRKWDAGNVTLTIGTIVILADQNRYLCARSCAVILYKTARDVLDLFRAVAPVVHKDVLDTVRYRTRQNGLKRVKSALV